MTTQQIAERLVTLCRQGQFETAQQELFSTDARSIEPHASPAFEKETNGLDAIIEKGHKFNEMVEEMYGMHVSDPIVAGQSFAVIMTMDVKMKGREKEHFSELCVYEVKDGKIASESFLM
ncbi:MAG: hypothetical protein NVSMB63_01660 [Sediminibacterium sp.]